MRALLTSLLALALSVVLTLAVKLDNGYVLIGFQQWSVEGSLALFLIFNLLIFVTLYILLRAFARVWSIPRQLHGWQDHRSQERARREFNRGLVQLSEGEWQNAEKSLVRFATRSEAPLLNYLAAARSAQQQGAHDRRDHYLRLAHACMPSADVAVGLTQAELQLEHAQLEQALATLRHLRTIAPRHTHVLKLLKILYERLGDWNELNALLPELKKRQVVAPAELKELEIRVCRMLLQSAAKSNDGDSLRTTWKSFPPQIRENEAMVMFYANHLKASAAEDEVVQLLRRALDHDWSDALAELYGSAEASDIAAQLTQAEKWLIDRPNNPTLLLALGRLCLKNRLWGKARSYLEASISIQPSPAAYSELGVLLEGMGEKEQALTNYRAALTLSSETPLPQLPVSLGVHNQLESPTQEEIPTDINPPRLNIERVRAGGE
ncbi:MAG: heme biosynthesis protein HemY [Gammaproteobacteria bacterium]|nr:heme biosynthesis protein HemY [Gammaproteobacteria bacterium]MCP5417137.1 heme biosynthesis protein HemY [Chromatiaceae bacterium]